MRKYLPLFIGVLAMFLAQAFAASAQTNPQVPSQVLVLDSDRAYISSVAGQQINKELEQRLAGLVAENRAIETKLEAEELEITEKRAITGAAEFRALADNFDQKVQQIRAEQDAKQQELLRLREGDRQSFLDLMSPIISQIAIERGARVILERRNVLLSAESLDITDEVIRRINQELASETNPADDGTQNQGED